MDDKFGVKAILAQNRLGFIGLNLGLPWSCKADFSHFKKLTANSTLVVGYNTYQTLPPLKGRRIILDGPLLDFTEIDWCIGGKKTYEKYCHLFTELHVSHISDDTIGDTMFPDLGRLNPECKIFHYYFEGDNEYVLTTKGLVLNNNTNKIEY